MRASWAKLDDGRWGVRVTGNLDSTGGLTGQTVSVFTRDHQEKRVRLGRRITSWNGGRTSIYEVAR